ncbi:MAG TPA: PIN domain-containing protein [Terracidiphilus sp.]|nr:PIN domain-containing protein [Terracidiphilus sp.]
MNGRTFLDTNVLIYAFADNSAKLGVAERLVNRGGAVNIQILNELANALHRKFGFGWLQIREIIDSILVTCPDPLPLGLETHRAGLRICERYGYSVYDGLIIAAALEADCRVLYSEDMQHGQVIDGLRIENPFRAISAP